MRVWAPTARAVTLRLFDGPTGGHPASEVAMIEGEGTGVWTAQGGADWQERYYQYAVEVFHPWADGAPPSGSGNIVTSIATDPYSRSLAADGERTHICDIEHAPELKPAGWDQLRKSATTGSGSPPGSEPTDMAVYELHVRDFSAMDSSVPPELRGKYGAFGASHSHAVKHLTALAGAGLNPKP